MVVGCFGVLRVLVGGGGEDEGEGVLVGAHGDGGGLAGGRLVLVRLALGRGGGATRRAAGALAGGGGRRVRG